MGQAQDSPFLGSVFPSKVLLEDVKHELSYCRVLVAAFRPGLVREAEASIQKDSVFLAVRMQAQICGIFR